MTQITYDEYVDWLCKKRGCTKDELRAWLRQTNRVIAPCADNPCEYDECQGWVCRWPTPEEEEATLGKDDGFIMAIKVSE